MKYFVRTLIFLGILTFALAFLSKVFRPVWNTDDILSGYKSEEKNSIDVLFVGDSDIYNGISPMEIYEKYGITSYDYASSAASNLLMYYMMLEALKTQTPKVVVMDETSIFGYKEGETNTHRAMDLMPLDSVKFGLINDAGYNFNIGDRLTILFPFFRYHDRWNKINLNDFNKDSEVINYYKGYTFSNTVKAAENEDSYMEGLNEEVDFSTSYLPASVIKAKEYCDEHGIEFLLISMPDTSAWSYAKYEKMSEWTKENNINYVDFNMLLDEVGISFKTDTPDGGMHLNISGAIKLSNYLGKYLSENYDLPDHRGEWKYKKWDESLMHYIDERNNYYAEIKNNKK
jgi:hypothetical protein